MSQRSADKTASLPTPGETIAGKPVRALRAEWNARVPADHTGSARRTAFAALLLRPDEAPLITGAILPVDGGTSVTIG